MIIIAHRGNLDGPNKEKENSESYIFEAIDNGFNVEVDIWVKDKKIYLGHDEPTYISSKFFLRDIKHFAWYHAKNIEALTLLRKMNLLCFWHQEDNYTLTSKNHIWVYPGQKLVKGSIAVMPEIASYSNEELDICGGICTDFPKKYINKI